MASGALVSLARVDVAEASAHLGLVGWRAYALAGAAGVAVLSVHGALLGSVLDRPVFTLLALPVVLCAIALGGGAGLTATLVVATGTRLFFFGTGHPGTGDRLAWWMLIAVGLTVSLLSRRLHRSREDAQAALDRETRGIDALRASEARLEAVIDSLEDGLIIGDADGTLRHWNPAALAMLELDGRNLPAALAAYQDVFEVTTLEGTAIPYDEWPMNRALRGEPVRGVELGLRRKGQAWSRILCYNAIAATDATGRPLVLLSIRDITAAKRTEAALRDERDRLASLAESAPGVIHTVRIDARGHFAFLYVSARAADVLGVAAEELIEWPERFPSIWDPADAPRLGASIQASRQALTPWHQEFRIRHATKGTVWIEGRSTPVADADGGVTWHGMLVDVTERRRAESALRESDERFRQVVENIREVFWMTDVDKAQMVYISPGYEHVWGRPVADLFVDAAAWMAAIHAEDREMVMAALPQQAQGTYDLEYRIVRPDGSIRWIHDRAFPVCDAEGRVYRVAGLAEDVTARRQLEDQFRHAQKMEAVGQLASGVAHDFNNLLTVIQGNAALIQMGLPSAAEIEDCAQQVLTASDRAAGLTRQLLLFSRRQMMRPSPLDINTAVHGLIRMLGRIVGEHIEIAADCAEPLPRVRGDAGMIEQAIVNLVVNARDAMPGGGRVTIGTALAPIDHIGDPQQPPLPPGTYVRITVEDTGCGIPAEHLPHVFEPFFTTKDVGKGTGLGLATVYGIVQQHGGHVDLRSELGRGTTVRMWLPVSRDGTDAGEGAVLARALPRGSETVLLVEDEPSVRTFVETVLRRCGYTVLSASNGESAIELWRREGARVALLLTDLVIPGSLTGGEVAQRLRQESPDLRVVYSSGYSNELTGPALALDVHTRFLPKPYQPAALAHVVREALDG